MVVVVGASLDSELPPPFCPNISTLHDQRSLYSNVSLQRVLDDRAVLCIDSTNGTDARVYGLKDCGDELVDHK
jgi:hypothetical protein